MGDKKMCKWSKSGVCTYPGIWIFCRGRNKSCSLYEYQDPDNTKNLVCQRCLRTVKFTILQKNTGKEKIYFCADCNQKNINDSVRNIFSSFEK